MALTIRDTKTTPRERKWWYPAVDGPDISETSYSNLKRAVSEHYRSNGRPAPTEQQIIDYLCANLSVPCYEGKEQIRNLFTDPPPVKSARRRTPGWGLFAPLKLIAKDGDRGLGDIVARTIGPVGGDAFKAWYKAITGESCGCTERQEEWNYIYPL